MLYLSLNKIRRLHQLNGLNGGVYLYQSVLNFDVYDKIFMEKIYGMGVKA